MKELYVQWQEAVEAGNTTDSFEDWAADWMSDLTDRTYDEIRDLKYVNGYRPKNAKQSDA